MHMLQRFYWIQYMLKNIIIFSNANLNIGALVVDSRTREYIANAFSALSITCEYELTIMELMANRDIFRSYYDKECFALFDIFWEKNHARLLEK